MAEDGNDRATRHLMEKLLEQRIVTLCEPVGPKTAERLVAQFLYLDAQDSKKPIHLYLNTPGGSMNDGFAVFDTIRFIKAPVISICTGLSASMGTVLMLAPRTKKNRVCLPNTRFMIHQPSSAYQGSASDIEISAKQILKLRDRLIEIYVEETKMDADRVRTDLNRDYWMSAEEAVDYGLCDRVIERIRDLS
ncbi:MAG: ClpP family protease [Planctomycetota bacterium]|jgi:ATP-dependent Clp protease protease subunit